MKSGYLTLSPLPICPTCANVMIWEDRVNREDWTQTAVCEQCRKKYRVHLPQVEAEELA